MNRKLVLIVTLIGIMSATVLLVSEAFDHGISVLNNESQTLESFFFRDTNFTNTLIPVWGNWTWNMSANSEGYSRFLSSGGAGLYYNETGGKGWMGAVFLQGTHPHTGFRDFILGGVNRQSAVLKEYVAFSRSDKIPENGFMLSAKVIVHERNHTDFGNQSEAVSNVGVDLIFGYNNANYHDPDWNHSVAIHADVLFSRAWWDNVTRTLHHNENGSYVAPSPYDKDYHLPLIRGKIENVGVWNTFNIDLGEIIETIFTLLPDVNTLYFRGAQVYIDGISSYAKATFSYVYTTLKSERFTPVFQKGMSYATYAFKDRSDQYERPQSDESLEQMKRVGITWVAINVVWYQDWYNSTTIYPNVTEYSPTNESVEYVINKAHELGMKVMLKPKIDVSKEPDPNKWSGKIQPSTAWFQGYTTFISFFAEMAEKHNVELFCIGCELMSIEWNVSWYNSWQNIVSGVRTHYNGNVTYASTAGMLKYPESYRWWDNIDYVGINAYYALNLTANDFDPSIDELKLGWSQPIQEIEEWRSNKNISKPIIFTEIGYQAVNGTHTRPWDYTLMNKTEFELDPQEQADCYEAAFLALKNKTETWFRGMYWWYWQTDPNPTDPARGSEAVTMVLRDYTPQNKPAQGVLTHWYHVIPEFPSTAILILVLMITTFTAIVVKKRKLVKSMYARNISQQRSF